MQIEVLNTDGKITGKLELPDLIFAQKQNSQLVAQAVRIYLAHQRQARAKVKTRGNIRGSTRKIYRQKGTGRARHGDRYAPLFVGGGVAHGPQGNQNFKLSLSKKMRRRALYSVLSQKASAKEIIIIEGLEKLKPKTKLIFSCLENLKKKKSVNSNKISLILAGNSDSVALAGRNIKNLQLLTAAKLNTYEVLNGGLLFIMKDAVKIIEKTFLHTKAEASTVNKKKPAARTKKAKPKLTGVSSSVKPAIIKTKTKKLKNHDQ